MNDYPRTREEWWLLFESSRDNLKRLTANFHPYYKHINQKLGMPPRSEVITAPGAEAACSQVRKSIVTETEVDPIEQFENYARDKNPDIVTLLNQVWFGLPEAYEIRSVDGFGALCDLCSEGYLLYDEEDNEERQFEE